MQIKVDYITSDRYEKCSLDFIYVHVARKLEKAKHKGAKVFRGHKEREAKLRLSVRRSMPPDLMLCWDSA